MMGPVTTRRLLLIGLAALLAPPLAAVEEPAPPEVAASPSPSPSPHAGKPVSTIEQRLMSVGEMVDFFSNLKVGTALRLTYSNGAEFAGNFEGREPGRALIYCTRDIGVRRQVPLRKVMDAYIIVSATHTLRIHHKDFPWKDK